MFQYYLLICIKSIIPLSVKTRPSRVRWKEKELRRKAVLVNENVQWSIPPPQAKAERSARPRPQDCSYMYRHNLNGIRMKVHISKNYRSNNMKASLTTIIIGVAAVLSIAELQLGHAFVIPRTRKVKVMAPITVQNMVATTAAPPSSASTEKLSPEAKELETILEDNLLGKKRRKLLVAQTAPSVRVAFSELIGEAPGSFDTGVLVASLKELGFDFVLDTNTAA